MRKKPSGPLKAYRIFWCGELIAEPFVGRNSSQAKAAFARSTWTDGANTARQVWGFLRAIRCRDNEEERQAVEDFEDRGKHWRDTRRAKRLQAQCDAFNAAYPVGTPVQVVGCWEVKYWPNGITTIRTPAWLPHQSNILVSVEGLTGGLSLKFINPTP
jgi:hypothetical protein